MTRDHTPALLGDPSYLHRSPSPYDLRWYRRTAGVPWHRSVTVATCFTVLGVAAILALVNFLPRFIDTSYFPPVAHFIIMFAPLTYALLAVAGYLHWLKWRMRDVRLWRFATSNGLEFTDRVDSGSETWHISRSGTGFPKNMRNVERAILGNREVIVARNQVMQNKNQDRANVRRPFAFALLHLSSEVPHIILKNKRARVLSLMGLGLGNRTKLSLEGDFDRHFTLLCPEGYETDALAIFTPDVMAAVIDVAGSCEVELIDSELYLYFRFDTPIWKPATMEKLQAALSLLQERFERQTARYRDDRAGLLAERVGVEVRKGSVSLAGRRITDKDGISALTWVGTGIVILLSGVVTALTLFVWPNL